MLEPHTPRLLTLAFNGLIVDLSLVPGERVRKLESGLMSVSSPSAHPQREESLGRRSTVD
jgi:hypothetical protein